MDLTTLAAALQNQAKTNGDIVLDATVLSSADAASLAAAFLLPSGQFLTISGVTPADVPDPQGTTLTITAGTVAVFGQSGLSQQLVFTQTGTDISFTIAIDLPATWTFTDSFANLALFPFDLYSLQESCFIYSSTTLTSYAPWTDKPTETVPLSTGLNFAGWVKVDQFSAVVALLAKLIGADTAYKFYGPFVPGATGYPVTSLSAVLSEGDFSLGYAPLTLTVDTPIFLTEVSAADDSGTQAIGLALAATLPLGLQLTIAISASGDAITITAAPPTGQTFTAEKILQLPGGDGFQSVIPSELTDIFANVGLDNYSMVMLTGSGSVGSVVLEIGTVNPWKIIPGEVELDSLTLQLSLIAPSTSSSLTAVSISASATILPKVFTDGVFSFDIDIEKPPGGSWEVDRIQGSYNGVVKLGDLVTAILGGSVTVPSELNDVTFYNFGIVVNETNSSYNCYGGIGLNFPLLGTQINSAILVNVTYSSNAFEVSLTGELSIGEQSFEILLDFTETSGKDDLVLSASWTATGTDYLTFEDIAAAFGWDSMPPIPSELDLDLTAASFKYHYSDGSLVLGAKSNSYGEVVFATLLTGQAPNQTRQYFFLLDTAANPFSLSDLPLVGAELAKIETISVSDINVIISSQPSVDATLAGQVNTIINSLGTGYPNLPADGISGEFMVSANLELGNEKLPLSVSMGGSSSSGSSRAAGQALPASEQSLVTTGTLATVPTDSASSGGITWFNVQKSFGPVSIGRIGVMYQSSQQALWFELDATLAIGPLSLSLVGLGIGSPIKSFHPEFSLQGLGVGYSKPPLEIAGALVNLAPPGADYIEFEGGVMISTSEFTLETFGYYGNKGGFSSMFIFGALAYPFGGPAAFFLTGIALGFGYNSDLRIPTIDEVQSFPFVQVLPTSTSPNTSLFGPNPTPVSVLDVIMNTQPPWVTATQGSLWFGAGITFTSFELVNSQAMLFVEIGDGLVIALIGDSRAQFPPQVDGAGPLYANIELDIEIRFAPAEGVFSVQAVLASSSFLLDPACVLTGGFAFFVWYGKSPYAGDFVVTLGGYNPGFTPPSYYPTVPIVGFHWSMDSSITISGGAYFALTPAAMMVGGRLEATYQSGNLKAWFDAHADVIVRWKPFWFDAQIGISIGASYKIDLLFTTATVSVELGCDLEFYGPPSGGSVTVDWYIISFTIPFGASKGSGQAINGWSDVEGMLPNSSNTSTKNVLVATAVAGVMPSGTAPSGSKAAKASLGAAAGDGAATPWLVRGSQFAFSASTPIPATLATVGDTYSFNGSTFDVFPLGWSGISSTLNVAITDAAKNDRSSAFEVALLRNGVPSSLWGAPPVDKTTGNQQVPSGAELLVGGQITGVSVQVTPPQIGASAGAVDVESALAFVDLELPGAVLPLSGSAQPTGDVPVNGGTTISVIANNETGIASTTVTASRNAIFAGLTTLGYQPVTTNDPMTGFAGSVGCAFSAEPLLVD